ncbi:SGNH/GDSL hydrolase family protein [Embleya sp. NBC_00896]|uniref:SGNH/GDSL hydrolase family protein n=1 Tax=Embleya sp. NBC_00896 TaxID=2975961 RepID=UPI002F90FDBD|nr:SGNH/GDSL hydrolase family protein [Embleya sp. NBC_00896]
MQSPCRAAASVAVTVVLALVGLAAPSARAEPGSRYVALGDSYSSGVGAGDYLAGSGDCKRSASAYPALWNKAHPADEFAFVACSGATSADVRAGQLSALTSATSLVTISVGGNDVGFATTIATCVFGSDRQCADAVGESEAYTRERLPADLDTTYAQIRDRAPNARLVVLGYPRLFELGSCLFGLSEAKRVVLDRAADTLAATTAGRAGAAGADFTDVRTRFAGHGVCASDAWLHGLALPFDESYHPTDAGQAKGYLPELTVTLTGA